MRFFRNAKRPVFWMGHGIRLSGAVDLLPEFLNRYQVPTILSWSGTDMIDSNHPLVFGRAGVYGQRCANKVIEEADAIVAIGTRLSLLQIGYDPKKIKAKLCVVDIDSVEAEKWKPELMYLMDAGDFLKNGGPGGVEEPPYRAPLEWISMCSEWRNKYPWVESPTHDDNGYYNSYRFMEILNRHLKPDQIIVTDVAGPNICANQVLKLKPPQRLMTSQGLGEMGVGLPFAIGASFARQRGEILCLHTDGAMMMNLQELQTISHYKLPIKIIVFSNDGYLMIKHTQKVMFDGRRTGVDQESGVSFPQYGALVPNFGEPRFSADPPHIPCRLLKIQEGIPPPLAASLNMPIDADDAIRWLMSQDGPALLEVVMNPEQSYFPRLQAIKNPDGSITSPKLSELSPNIDQLQMALANA